MYWKKYCQPFKRLTFVQTVNTAVPTELWFKDSYIHIMIRVVMCIILLIRFVF